MDAVNKDVFMAQQIASLVEKEGGRVYYVGGFVRDRILNSRGKDVDVEVHGITEEKLIEIMDSLGTRIEKGSSFGVFGLAHYDLDIAMPRTERKTGRGHTDFHVTVEPFMGTYKAARRRDFTINAMMQDVLTGEIIDHFGGMADLAGSNKDAPGVIRHVNDSTFTEDPLRVLRAAQFAARFEFNVAQETLELCKSIDLSDLPRERIEGEMKKALLKASRPSVFFEVLREMNQLDVWFPELKQLIGLEQNPRFHREGDVWNHTMLSIDNAAALRDKVQEPYPFMLSVLCHDLGKIVSTEFTKGARHAYDHEVKGMPVAHDFVMRITRENRVIKYVMSMVELHMEPNRMKPGRNNGGGIITEGAKVKSTNNMFDKAVNPLDLIYVAIADGLSAVGETPYVNPEEFLLERLAVYEEIMARPHVTGDDLIEAGLKPEENFREILAHAHKLRLAGIDKEEALKQTLGYAGKLRK